MATNGSTTDATGPRPTMTEPFAVFFEVWRLWHGGVHGMIVGELLDVLTEAQLRLSPAPGMASVAWEVWHVARCEDAAVNALVADRPQVLDEPGWPRRLGVARRDIGTGMTPEEVAAFNALIDLAALRAYLEAVKKRTREVVAALPPETWGEEVDATRVDAAVAAHVLGANAGWVPPIWIGKTKGWVLWWLTFGHHCLHFGEATVTGDLARRELPDG